MVEYDDGETKIKMAAAKATGTDNAEDVLPLSKVHENG